MWHGHFEAHIWCNFIIVFSLVSLCLAPYYIFIFYDTGFKFFFCIQIVSYCLLAIKDKAKEYLNKNKIIII